MAFFQFKISRKKLKTQSQIVKEFKFADMTLQVIYNKMEQVLRFKVKDCCYEMVKILISFKCQQLKINKYIVERFDGDGGCVLLKVNKNSAELLEKLEKWDISLLLNVIKIENKYFKPLVINATNKFKLRLTGKELNELYANRHHNRYYYSKIFKENWFIFGRIYGGKLFLKAALLQAPHKISLINIRYKISCNEDYNYAEVNGCNASQYIYNIDTPSDYKVLPQNLTDYFRLKLMEVNQTIDLNIEIRICDIFSRYKGKLEWPARMDRASDDLVRSREWSSYGVVDE